VEVVAVVVLVVREVLVDQDTTQEHLVAQVVITVEMAGLTQAVAVVGFL
jgi:hypothetical protein